MTLLNECIKSPVFFFVSCGSKRPVVGSSKNEKEDFQGPFPYPGMKPALHAVPHHH